MEKPHKKPHPGPKMHMPAHEHEHDHHHHHKIKMFELCQQYLKQKVSIQTVHGDQFNAIIDHVTPDIVYLIPDYDDHGWGGYGGYGGFGGNPAASYAVAWGVPLVLLATIGTASGYGYGGGFGW